MPVAAFAQLSREQILITGASGLLGRQLVYELTQQDIRPVCLVRETSDTSYLDSLGLEKRYADLRDQQALEKAFAGVDRVIHTAAHVDFRGDKLTQFTGLNSFGALFCYRAAVRAGVKRFVHVSSVVGVGAASIGGARLSESSEFTLDNVAVPYLQSKRQGERLLLDELTQTTELVIVNPSIIVAPSRHGRDRERIDRLMSRRYLPSLPNRLNLVDLRDVSRAITSALVLGESGRRYLLTGENLTVDQLLDNLTMLTGKSPGRFHLPLGLLRQLAKLSEWRHRRRGGKLKLYRGVLDLLSYDWVYDNSQASRMLDFSPRPLKETLRDLYHGSFTGTFLD